MRKTPLKKRSRGESAVVKQRIQDLLKQLVRLRDKQCILYNKGVGRCGGVISADHIISRRIAITYAEPLNVVALCIAHHFLWKPSNPTYYTHLVKETIGENNFNYIHELAKQETHYRIDDWLDKEQQLKEILTNYGI